MSSKGTLPETKNSCELPQISAARKGEYHMVKRGLEEHLYTCMAVVDVIPPSHLHVPASLEDLVPLQ